jgi:hypothetical protein
MLGALAVLPAALPAAAGAAADPIFIMIERHRELSAHLDAAVSVAGKLLPGPDFDAADAICAERHDVLMDHGDRLICTEPATLAGVVALMRYMASVKDWEGPGNGEAWEINGVSVNWYQVVLSTLADAVDQIVVQG